MKVGAHSAPAGSAGAGPDKYSTPAPGWTRVPSSQSTRSVHFESSMQNASTASGIPQITPGARATSLPRA